jgi:hypothetical protein
MPVPEGELTTSEILVPDLVPLDEAIAEADAEPATEEYTLDEEVIEE